jgi:hypothetical protein
MALFLSLCRNLKCYQIHPIAFCELVLALILTILSLERGRCAPRSGLTFYAQRLDMLRVKVNLSSF